MADFFESDGTSSSDDWNLIDPTPSTSAYTGVQVYPDGNGGYTDINGNMVDSTGQPLKYDSSGQLIDSNGNVVGQAPGADSGNVNNKTFIPGANNTDAAGNPIDPSGFSGILKSLFTDKNGNLNLQALGAVGGGVAGLLGAFKPNVQKTGYQGSIPQLQAIRSMVTAPPTSVNGQKYRPGQGGVNWGGDVSYVPKGSAPTAGLTALVNSGLVGGTTPVDAKGNSAPVVDSSLTMPYLQALNTSATKSTNPTDAVAYAGGGLTNLTQGRYLQGKTDGMADKIPAKIGEDQPAALSHGEFVVPADVVSHLGNGNSDAGAEKLYQMMDKIREARTGTKKQGKEINPDKFMPGGLTKGYADGGSVSGVGTAVNAGVTGTEQAPNTWAGQYMSDLLGQTDALTSAPYQQYGGPLTAGASDLQNKVFTGLQNTNFPGNLGTSFSSTGAYQPPQLNTSAYQTQPIGTGPTPGATGTPQPDNAGITAAQPQPSATSTPTGIASQYMNPYLQSVLDPQLAELRRQNDITNMQANAKMTGAGAFGGGRQAILNSENNRNLMQEMNKTVGQGYSNAYDKAMGQYNTEQQQGMGLANLMASQGNVQRGIESEGIAADKTAFESARQNPFNMLQFKQSMLNGMPISATNYNVAQPTALQQVLSGAGGIAGMFPNTSNVSMKDVTTLLDKLGLSSSNTPSPPQ